MTSEVIATHEHRAQRQSWFFQWAENVFGTARVRNRRVRAFRFLEEAVELVQTQGLTLEDVLRQVHYTYGRKVGEIKQEIGGVTLSLYALAENLGVDVDACEADELSRVRSADENALGRMRLKDAYKIEQGLI